jgi:hypothetical protein
MWIKIPWLGGRTVPARLPLATDATAGRFASALISVGLSLPKNCFNPLRAPGIRVAA